MKAIKTLLITAIVFMAIAVFNMKVSASEIELTIFAGENVYYYSSEEIGVYNGKRRLKCLEGVVDGIYYDTLTPPVSATATFVGGNAPRFSYTNEKWGLGIDKAKLTTEICFALNNEVKEITATFIKIKPEITKIQLQENSHLRASFKTDYSTSTPARKHNIELASSKLNGLTLVDGQTFSFNATVGKRTEENGFKNAVVIENGEYVTGIGGGVCQVSTTLYNCALLSGLTTTERHQHTLLPSYVQPSFDAMVAFPSCDLKFVNDSGGTIYISSYCNGQTVNFSIYGKKPTCSYSLNHLIISETPPPSPEIVYSDTAFEDEVLTLKAPKPQIKSQAFVTATKNGKIVKHVLLHTDTYKSVAGKLQVGTKKRENSEMQSFYLTKLAFFNKMNL